MTNQLTHLALIPDGNRRWAKAHNLPVLMGHRRVMEKVFPALVKKCLDLEIKYFTIWGFSTENWSRSQEEVEGLFKLFNLFFEKFGQKLLKEGVRITFIGKREGLDERFNQIINRWSELTQANEKLVLNIAFNYGGHDEIIRAINQILNESNQKVITEDDFTNYLDTSRNGLPAPDLIIRTSGEQRLSGFMSWQSAYSELYFSQKMMPDWNEEDLQIAFDDFHARQRRFGK